jgi:hypothetical protein
MLQQAHCDQLINALFPFAQQMLARAGTFHPFGAFINADGQVETVAGYDGNEHPQPREIIDLITRGFRQRVADHTCRAVGICVDVRFVPPGQTERVDAALASLEDAAGGLNVYLPYRKQPDGRIAYLDLVSMHAHQTIFPRTNLAK